MTALAPALGLLWVLSNLATACVLAAFLALAARAFALAWLAGGGRRLAASVHGVVGAAFLAAGLLYAAFTAHTLAWTASAAAAAAATAGAVLASLAVRRITPRVGPRPGLVGTLAHLVLLLALLLTGAVTLMGAGFLALTTDRPVLLIELTGQTRSQIVRWAPADEPPREAALTAYRVVFRTPEGAPVAEAWLYGDQVAVKGRVLRLSPVLNAAGLPNLFELQFAHNGFATAEAHRSGPHLALPLPPSGPLAVHPWWRPLQARLLERWERGTTDGSAWAVRSVTIESTYFPLVDGDGRPARRTHRLVLTPGGLSGG